MKNNKRDIGFGHLGNGLTVYDRSREVNGDYQKLAHIDNMRNIEFYVKNLSKADKDYIERVAATNDGNISSTQNCKIFKTPPITSIK